MKIKKVHIQGFRGIENLELDFCDPSGKPLDLVVIAGANGSGKTSILEAVALACGYELPAKKADPQHNTRLGCEDFEIRLTLALRGLKKEGEVIKRRTAPKQSLFSQEDIELRETPIEYFSSWREPKLVGGRSVSVGKKGKRPQPTEDNRLWIIKQHLIDLTARRGFEQQASLIPIQEEPPFRAIASAWGKFYKNQWFDTRPVSKEVDAGFDLYRVDQATDQRIPVDDLSSGEIELLTLLGWFAIKKDFGDSILFFDEPELHLHPTWQRKILKALKIVLPTTQIICATHSPQLISEVDPENMFLLKTVDGRIEAFKPESSWGMDTNRILEDLLDTPERPEEIKNQIKQLFDEIDRKDFQGAHNSLASLQERIPNDHELVRAEVLLRRKEAIGR